MNELDNHDHSRFLTRTNHRVGRVSFLGPEAAGEDISYPVLREAVLIQMTFPGAPTIYYGDEAGVCGFTDPDNRRTYPWGHEDASLIAFYKALAKLREDMPVLRGGSLKPLCAGYGYIAYARFDASDTVIVACNNTERPILLDLPLRDLGIADATPLLTRLCTNEDGYDTENTLAGTVTEGILRLTMPAHSASILTPQDA
jgi:alpha-glucosidase